MMMSSVAATKAVETTRSVVAPWWHTVLMLVALAAIAIKVHRATWGIGGSLRSRAFVFRATSPYSRLSGY